MASNNNYPKLHNAAWPGVVGKGAPDSEPVIALDTLLELTSKVRNAVASAVPKRLLTITL